MSNLFVTIGGRLVTPVIDRAGVAGAMRAAVHDAARATGIDVNEARLSPGALTQADEAFLTNAVIGVIPVADLCGRSLAAGALTRRLQQAIAAAGAASKRAWTAA
jgi:4-amino-4-deoxychorismate lyase